MCQISHTPEDSCFQTSMDIQVSSQENTDYWVKFGKYKSINHINSSDGLLALFNPCQGKTVWAIIDTGACKSVITGNIWKIFQNKADDC